MRAVDGLISPRIGEFRRPGQINLSVRVHQLDSRDHSENMKHFILILSLFGLLLAPRLQAAIETTLNSTDILLQQELRQERIKTTTERVGIQLDAIIDEYERNGLGGDDVAVLKAIRGVLGSLTQSEIKKVIELLQFARLTTNSTKSSESTLNAYAGQKSIIVQLRHLLLEYKRQQIIREIARRFAELGKRQGNNMHETISLAKATMGRDARRSKESHRISLQLQSTEQVTLSDESKLVVGKLEEVVKEMDGIAAEKPKAAVARAQEGRLLEIVGGAAGDLKESKLLSAAGNEKRARDLFIELARMLRPDRNKLQVLKEALKELEQAIAKQEQVAKDTQEFPEQRSEQEDHKQQVEKHQAQVVDETEMVREDVEEAAPKAASALKESIEKMQEARGKLRDYELPRNQRKGAPPVANPVAEKQAEALKKMAEAKQDLEQQIAQAEKEKDEPQDKLQQMKKLLAEVSELSREQEMINEDSKAAAKQPEKLPSKSAQQEIQKAKTLDAQAKATPLLKPAAESLAEAAKQMDKAAKTMAKKLDAPASQQAAKDALKRAESQLSQEVAKLEQAEQQLAKLDELAKKVSALIEKQQQVQLDTAKAAESPEPQATQQAKDAAPKQQQLTYQTANAADDAQKDAPEAAKQLSQAESNMAKATADLKKPDAKAAREDQAKALADLQAAQRSIDQKKDQLSKELGKPEENKPDLLAQASQAVTKAQMEVNKAVNQLSRPASLNEFLKSQQESLARAVKAKAAEKPNSKALAQAQESTKQAAEKLKDNDVDAAIGEMAKAQAQLQAAAKETPSTPSAQSGKPQSQASNNPAGKPQASDSGKPAADGSKSPAGKSGEQQANAGKPGEPSGNQSGKPAGGQPQAGDQPSLPQLAKEQGDLKELATQLAQLSIQPASTPLDAANSMISPLASGSMNQLPLDAALALRQAQQALTAASAQAASNQASPAAQSAQTAQETLSKAASALALAQKGLGNKGEEAQKMAEAEGGKGESDQKGKGQAKGPGKNKAKDDSKEGEGDGNKGNFEGQGGTDGKLRQVADRNTFIGLPARERNAILQSMGEKYPEEFGPLVEQYLKNLSDAASKGSK